jgi:hypothetical protein
VSRDFKALDTILILMLDVQNSFKPKVVMAGACGTCDRFRYRKIMLVTDQTVLFVDRYCLMTDIFVNRPTMVKP